MSLNGASRRLRPYLFTSYARRTHRVSTARSFSNTTQIYSRKTEAGREATNDYQRRVSQLEAVSPATQWYPRLQPDGERTSTRVFKRRHEALTAGETRGDVLEVIAGRVQSVRTAGSKLVFLDLKQGPQTIQAIVQLNKLWNYEDEQEDKHTNFKYFSKLVRKGDYYEVRGHPHRSNRGELSVLATNIPTLLSPPLHQIPDKLEDVEKRARSRHVDMLVNPSAIQTLRVRHLVEKQIRDFLDGEGFTAVHTPILTAGAGGAIARPFETEATELEGQKLNLRIAPELWLKRLVVGGLEKVYEMGPAFRNEGVDATHNPEFHICEFYEAFATLEDLMNKTEKLLAAISQAVQSAKANDINALPPSPDITFPFRRLEFLPTLQQQLGPETPLPDLSTPTAAKNLLEIFHTKNLQPPTNPTLPRLLDTLASHYLEPLCDAPTFITHHPAILSPLSKHFTCPTTHARVAARAELFVRTREVANMYEEENSPFAQREKFLAQLREGGGDAAAVDESYLAALEWGLPPTGGWGCGVERLVMLFAGRERLGDVLAFGSLRNVVGMSKGRS